MYIMRFVIAANFDLIQSRYIIDTVSVVLNFVELKFNIQTNISINAYLNKVNYRVYACATII